MRIATAVFLLLLLACGGKETASSSSVTADQPPQTAATLTPEQLGELGASIQKEPARADELLSQRGLTQESFERAIREVTENPDASKRYAASFKKSGA